MQVPEEMGLYGMIKTARLAFARGLDGATVETGVTWWAPRSPDPTRSENVGTFVEQMARERGDDKKPEEAANVAPTCVASVTSGALPRVDGGVRPVVRRGSGLFATPGKQCILLCSGSL